LGLVGKEIIFSNVVGVPKLLHASIIVRSM